jgi:hypothetical protein
MASLASPRRWRRDSSRQFANAVLASVIPVGAPSPSWSCQA